jgi:hypothetical protein
MSASIVFNQELLSFLHQGVSITAASRDARHIPSLSKAIGCRVLKEQQQISLFLNRAHSTQLLADVKQCGQLAVTFCLPSTLETLQIKGHDPVLSLPEPADHAFAYNCIQNFGTELEKAGYGACFAARYLYFEPEQLVVLSFTPTAIYEQSPGEKAGLQLEFYQC